MVLRSRATCISGVKSLPCYCDVKWASAPTYDGRRVVTQQWQNGNWQGKNDSLRAQRQHKSTNTRNNVSVKYRVIKNECRGFNNLSYTLFIIVLCGFVYFCDVWGCVCMGFVLYGCLRLM